MNQDRFFHFRNHHRNFFSLTYFFLQKIYGNFSNMEALLSLFTSSSLRPARTAKTLRGSWTAKTCEKWNSENFSNHSRIFRLYFETWNVILTYSSILDKTLLIIFLVPVHILLQNKLSNSKIVKYSLLNSIKGWFLSGSLVYPEYF